MTEMNPPAFTGAVLVLASASAGRAGTLRRAGIEPLIRVSEVDEDAVLAKWCGPDHDPTSAAHAAAKVTALAQAKARAVLPSLEVSQVAAHAAAHPALLGVGVPLSTDRVEAVVVGCDSMLECDGLLLGKPHSPQLARERILRQSGKTVVLHTGHCVAHVQWTRANGGDGDWTRQVRELSRAAATEVHFGVLTAAEVDAYVATGEPLEVAGAFTIDGLGGPFIEGVTGDPHSVVGISLPLLRQLTGSLGVNWGQLWNRGR